MSSPISAIADPAFTCWNDLPPDRALTAYLLVMAGTSGPIPEADLAMRRISLWRHLVGVTDAVWVQSVAYWAGEVGMEYAAAALAEEIEPRLASVDWAFLAHEDEEGQQRWRINPTFTRCPFPTIYLGSVKLYGPADRLSNITLYEMGQVFTLFEQYMEHGDDALITRLLATIWRPGKPSTPENEASAYGGDRRMPLRGYEGTLPAREALFKRWHESYVLLAMFWIASCRESIIAANPKVFDPLPDPDGVPMITNYGWGGIIMALADGLDKLEAVSDQRASNALVYLSYLEDQRVSIRLARKK